MAVLKGMAVGPRWCMAALVALSAIALALIAVDAAASSCPCPDQPKCGENADVFNKCFVALRKGEQMATIVEPQGFWIFKTSPIRRNCCELSRDCICEMSQKIKDVDVTTAVACLDMVDCRSWQERAPNECPCQQSCFENTVFGPCTEKFRKGENHVQVDGKIASLPVKETRDCCQVLEDRCKCMAKNIILNVLKQKVNNVQCLQNLSCE